MAEEVVLIKNENIEVIKIKNQEAQQIKCVFKVSDDINKIKSNIKKIKKISHPALLPIESYSVKPDEGEKGFFTLFYDLQQINLTSFSEVEDLSTADASKITLGVASLFQCLLHSGISKFRFDLSYLFLNEKNEPITILSGISQFGYPIFESLINLMKTCYPDQEDYIEIEFQDKLSDMSPFEAIDSALQSLYFSDRFGANSSDSYKPSLLSNTFSTQLFQKIYNENIALNEKVNDLTEEITELKEQFARYQQEDHDFKVQAYKIQELEKLVFDAVNVLNTYSFMKNELHIPLSMTDGGIFSYLINSQETVFSRSVIPSQSSGDVYCVINKNDPGNFSTGSSTKEYIKFLFPYPIRITGFSIQSSYRSFLRTWKVKTYDEDGDPTTIFRTKNDQSLNGEDKKLDITLDKVITTNKVKIIKKGYNWSKTKFVRIKNFELFSDQPEFIGGVFANMIKRANGDPHRADVYITSSNFDFRRFHKLSPSHSLCTLNDADSSWFQCELTKGKAVVQGYRLQFLSSFPITKYSIQGSNDLENWTVLDRVSTTKGETALLVVRECHSMQPFKYIRFFNEMVLEEKKLRFRHFDIFGVYLPE